MSSTSYVKYYSLPADGIVGGGVTASGDRHIDVQFSLPANMRILGCVPGERGPLIAVTDSGFPTKECTAYRVRVVFSLGEPPESPDGWSQIGTFDVMGNRTSIFAAKTGASYV